MLAHKTTHVNWDEQNYLNPLKSLTPKVKPKKYFKYFPTSLTYLLTYLVLAIPTYVPKYWILIHFDQNPKIPHCI
jgi:hypothetical protein